MEAPQVDGMQAGTLLGQGGSGRVFEARDDAGREMVVKVFDRDAVSVELLERMTRRLETGGWPEGVMPVVGTVFGENRVSWVMPKIGRKGEGAEAFVPGNLQMTLDQHPGADSWKLVRALARVLAGMHRRRVPHGNLKPGNVFLQGEDGVLVSDWAMGNMPGVRHFAFTDAVLYQAPEQLRNPGGYAEEQGYGWDVFAFGVLAFRVLTGRFPRCHETFRIVAPESGVSRREGLQADLQKVARNLEAQQEVVWPEAARGDEERAMREWIDQCLHLDPSARPYDMIEVAAGMDAVGKQAVAEREREFLMDQRRHAERRAWRSLFFAGAAATAALVMGALWHISTLVRQKEAGEAKQRVGMAEKTAEKALAEKRDAEKSAAEARHTLEYEKERALARLEASRLIGDYLFGWAMEKGHRRLPPLDGRELRLKRLEHYYEDFLTKTADVAELADERARVRLQLSEISLAAGDAPAATRRLAEALVALRDLPMDAELKLRMATQSLLLALLRQSIADPDTQGAFTAARKALEAVPQADVDADRLHQLLAILDFHEAKLLAARGEDRRALEQLLRATQTLNRVAEQRPDAAILRSELAACYLSSATILDGMGNLGDAREVRALATVELVRLIKENPDDAALRLDLAGCYGAMAESAVLSGDVAAAESQTKQALQLLDELLVAQPDNAEAVTRKASLLGLRAGIQRDRGFAAEAMKGFDEGIRMLEGARASAPGNAMVSYRLALLWWQKGRMIGMSGDHEDEISLIRRAADLLGKLETDSSAVGPRPEQLQSSSAYLLGDLGHALQLANKKDEATTAFDDAVRLWEGLVASRPQSEEYSEGLSWCRQRLADLK